MRHRGFVCFNGDMGRVMWLALLVCFGPRLAFASVEVSQDGARVSVRAEAAPLSEVLERLSRELGMKVVYEGPRPPNLVNASLVNRTPAEAVLSVLEGLGLNYLARLDVTGTRVEHLVVAGSAPAGSGAPPPATASAPPRLPPVVHDAQEDIADEEEDPAEVAPPQRPGPIVGGRPQGPRTPDTKPQGSPASGAGPVGNAPVNYPVSPFAPAAPAPPTVIAAPPTQPVDETAEETEEQ